MEPRTEHRPASTPTGNHRIRLDWRWLLVAVITVAGLAIAFRLGSTSPHTVDHVTLVNNSGYNLDVDVRGAEHDGALLLGTVRAHASTDVSDVIDQGPTWFVHFAGQGMDGGEVQIARADLVRSNWRIVVPDAVAARLHAEGAPLSPTSAAP